MIGALSARLLGAIALTGVASQSVEFTQQYFQRLGGAADELTSIVERFEDDAARQGLDRGAAIVRLRGNADPFVASRGLDMERTLERAQTTIARYQTLSETSVLFRPVVAASDPDWTILARAFEDYRPALPVTPDGFILTVAGFLLGWAGGASGHGATRMARRRWARRRGLAESAVMRDGREPHTGEPDPAKASR